PSYELLSFPTRRSSDLCLKILNLLLLRFLLIFLFCKRKLDFLGLLLLVLHSCLEFFVCPLWLIFSFYHLSKRKYIFLLILPEHLSCRIYVSYLLFCILQSLAYGRSRMVFHVLLHFLF